METHVQSQASLATRLATQSNASAQEFLSFELGAEEYGIDILKVQEIRRYEKPTRMAQVPEFIKGVINLRGIIVPIIDMRIKFSLPTVEYNDFTVVIILNVSGRVLGIVVDGVSDVITLSPEQIKPAPDFSSDADTSYIIGLGMIDQRMLILADIELLMAGENVTLAHHPTLQ